MRDPDDIPGDPLQRCRHVQVDGEWVHIPGCWGAIHDPAGCTCDVPGSALERAELGRQITEQEVERLRDKAHERIERCNAMFTRNRNLWNRVQELEAEVERLRR